MSHSMRRRDRISPIKPEDSGAIARRNGLPETANPYGDPDTVPRASAWRRGWRRQDRKISRTCESNPTE